MAKKKTENNLAPLKSGPLSHNKKMLTVGSLETALLNHFPREDAESWDHTGILVGDSLLSVKKVAVALDATVEAVEAAQKSKANVLVTHHPVYIEPPASFAPLKSNPLNPGSVVWAAIENGIALMCFHTALDVSKDAARVLPGLLHLDYKGVVDPTDVKGKKGYGQLCSIRKNDEPFTLGQLAARCLSVFGRPPRVWGDFDAVLQTVVSCTGSVGDLVPKAYKAGADVIICGEIRYHDALAAAQAGLAIIELGHDVSELPLVAPLVSAIKQVGIDDADIIVIDQNSHWASPESTRV